MVNGSMSIARIVLFLEIYKYTGR